MGSVTIVDTFTGTLTDALTATIEFLPTLVMATLIAVVGSAIGFGLGRFTKELANYANLDSRAANTPLGALFAGRPLIASIAGVVVQAYGVLVSLYLAANYAGLTGLTAWLNRLVGYLPQFLGGLAVIAAGVMITAYGMAAAERSVSGLIGATVVPVLKGILYFMVVVVGVDTMGINVQIVYVVGETLGLAFGLGLALALGLAVGLGSKEYVSAHVEQWADSAGSASSAAGGSAGGGMSDDSGLGGGGMDDSMDSGMTDDGGMDDDWDDGSDEMADDDWDDGGVEDLSGDDWEDDF